MEKNSKRFLTSFHAHVLFTTRQRLRRNTTQTEQSRTLEVVSVLDAERARGEKRARIASRRHRFSLKHIRCVLDTSANAEKTSKKNGEHRG